MLQPSFLVGKFQANRRLLSLLIQQNPDKLIDKNCFCMVDQIERDNWLKIAEAMESSGATESWFYKRARAIADGEPDPMPNVNQLMPESQQSDP